MTFSCSGCKKHDVTFRSSVEHETSNQTVVVLGFCLCQLHPCKVPQGIRFGPGVTCSNGNPVPQDP